MSDEAETNYYKMVACLVDVAPDVLREYFETNILQGTTFALYLTKHKHTLFHLYQTLECCKCIIQAQTKNKVLSKEQYELLYEYDDTVNPNFAHIKKVGKKTLQTCICNLNPKRKITTQVLDITLFHCIFNTCMVLEVGISGSLSNIKNIRNEIFHLSDIKSFPSSKFHHKWKKLETAIRTLAVRVSQEYDAKVYKRLQEILNRSIVSGYKIKEFDLLHEWWREKCAEMEKVRQEDFLKYTDILSNIPELVSHLRLTNDIGEEQNQLECSGNRCNRLSLQPLQVITSGIQQRYTEVFSKLEMLNCLVDQVTVNIIGNSGVSKILQQDASNDGKTIIPVLLHFEVPSIWDENKVIAALEQLIKKDQAESAIKIKSCLTGELTILTEIIKELMKGPDMLRYEIQGLVKAIAEMSRVDTQHTSNVDICMVVLDNTDKDTEIDNGLCDSGSQRSKLKSQFNLSYYRDERGELKSRNIVEGLFISDERLICIDQSEKRLLLCNYQGITNQIDIDHIISDISFVDEYTIAILIPSLNKVKILSTTDIVELRSVCVPEACFGIAAFGNNLFLACAKKGIVILTLTGDSERLIETDVNNRTQIRAIPDKILNTDYWKKMLICHTFLGEKIFEIAFDGYPNGITSLSDDSLLISCSPHEEQNVCASIEHVSSDGKRRESITDEFETLENPTAITYSIALHKLMIAEGNEIYIYDYKATA